MASGEPEMVRVLGEMTIGSFDASKLDGAFLNVTPTLNSLDVRIGIVTDTVSVMSVPTVR